MAPRKPKAPEKRPKPLIVRLLSTTALWLGLGARGLGRQAMRHPAPALSGLLFFGIFGTVAANALWYQPQRLETPFFATRDFERFDALPGLRRAQNPAGGVTTFRIERDNGVVIEGETPASTAAALPADNGDETASIIRQAEGNGLSALPQPAGGTENVALAVAVQQALIRRGLYNGAADGVIGPRTTAAILFFEQTEGLPETGAVTEDLLKRLAEGAPPAETTAATSAAAPLTVAQEVDDIAAAIRSAPVPVSRPRAEEAARPVKARGGSDDLASLIRANEGNPGPTAQARTGTAEPVADPGTISQIQAGLRRMAYQNGDPDGVAGPGTRAAIRQFQKYYRLPITGHPSAEVLQKLKEIGAV